MTRVIALLAVLAGCSVNHRSGDFECTTQSDCNANLGAGFTCTMGLCISTSPTGDGPGPNPDGPPTGPDAFVCPSQCTSCRQDTHDCKVDCGASPATCNSPINCPAGFHCQIICSSDNACANINCTGGASCDIQCKSGGTCKSVTCGDGPCNVSCTGVNSCHDVNCASSCKCDVACTASSSCFDAPMCPAGNGSLNMCTVLGLKGCNSSRTGCTTCQ